MKHKESKLQQQCVKWFRLQYPKEVLFAIPNGGKRSKIEAAIMKGEGVLSGVADLFLMRAKNGFNGLFIEMKHGKGKQTENQTDFEYSCVTRNYKYEVCNSLDDFMSCVNNYLI